MGPLAALFAKIMIRLWVVRRSDKSPIKGVYSSQPVLKSLEIHQVFLYLLPWLAEIPALYGCCAVLQEQ